jgi:hypothetical protein
MAYYHLQATFSYPMMKIKSCPSPLIPIRFTKFPSLLLSFQCRPHSDLRLQIKLLPPFLRPILLPCYRNDFSFSLSGIRYPKSVTCIRYSRGQMVYKSNWMLAISLIMLTNENFDSANGANSFQKSVNRFSPCYFELSFPLTAKSTPFLNSGK